MKKLLCILLFLVPNLYSETIGDKIDKLVPVLINIESGGDLYAVGDNGNALGQLQIWDVVIDDVNRVYGTKYIHFEAYYYHNSIEIAVRYLTYWGNHYKKKTGKEPTMEILAKIWNGGPNGYKKEATVKYWEKVKNAML